MAQNGLYTALRSQRSAPVQLPIFLVPSFARTAGQSPNLSRSRSYANHAKLPERGPDPSASRKHLKPDFPMNTKIRHRETNKKRGVSVIRSTGTRLPLSISKHPLPVPVIDPERRKQFPTDPNHGLWDFFYEKKKAMIPPEEMAAHGRSWTYAELSLKSFEDLYALYWVGHKEINRVLTNSAERQRVHAGYGAYEEDARVEIIKDTCKKIKSVLRDRYESVQEAIGLLDGKTPLAEMNLDESDEHYEDLEDFSDPYASEGTSSTAQDPPTAQIPRWNQLQEGTQVHIVLKADQPLRKLTTGKIADFLSEGDHPRGIKVRLSDGQVGRVQALAE